MTSMRTKGKSTIVWILMGMLVLGLGGFGVTNFSAGGTDVASVGDKGIPQEEYTRNLRSDMQRLSVQAGRNITLPEAEALGVPQAVLARLLTAAVFEAEAERLGVSVGDKVVADQIASAPGFQRNGRFDRAVYADLLRREGLSEAAFEQDVRMDVARGIIQRAVTGGVPAPDAMVSQSAAWLLEQRDIRWQEITPDQLATPVGAPDEETLKNWHQANADRFTSAELRKITYVSLTPEMLADGVQVDEAALKELYDSRQDEYQQPERRLVSRLVYPTAEAAQAARKRVDDGSADFAALAAEQGLSLEDTDLGEVTQAQLGSAGEAVFAPDQPGVVGPVQTDLGPALFSMNAILEPVNISFEEARDDLVAEAATDRARRLIEEKSTTLADELAGGATLEDLAKDGGMELATIDYDPKAAPEPGAITGYAGFRAAADSVTAEDFPEIQELDDGGIFALRLEQVIAPHVIDLEEIRDRVVTDWTANETHRQLLALAEDRKLAVMSEDMPQPQPQPGDAAKADAGQAPQPQVAQGDWHKVADLDRDGGIDGVPLDLVTRAFTLKQAGDALVVDAEKRIFVVVLDAIQPAQMKGQRADEITEETEARLSRALQADLFEYYARAAETAQGIRLNQQALDAAKARVQ